MYFYSNFQFFIFNLFKKSETISDNHYVTSKQSVQDYFKDKSKKKALRQHQQSQSIDDHQINSGRLLILNTYFISYEDMPG